METEMKQQDLMAEQLYENFCSEHWNFWLFTEGNYEELQSSPVKITAPSSVRCLYFYATFFPIGISSSIEDYYIFEDNFASVLSNLNHINVMNCVSLWREDGVCFGRD